MVPRNAGAPTRWTEWGGHVREYSRGMPWHVYIVRTRDGSLYTGITTDVARRLKEHLAKNGRGARYLRGRAPLDIVYRRNLGERRLALRVEWHLKRRPRAAKQAIVTDDPSRRELLRRLRITT